MARKCKDCGSTDISVSHCRTCGSYDTMTWVPGEEKPDDWDGVTEE